MNADTDGNQKVAYLTEKDATYALSQLGTWQADFCAVPLSTGSTRAEIEYFLKDSKAGLVLCSPKFTELVKSVPDCPSVVEVTHEALLGSNSVSEQAMFNG